MAHAIEHVSLVKMNGTKNEFVVLDERPPRFTSYPDLARRWCDPQRGVGADGLLVVLPPTQLGIATMRIFNADGSEAEMCGNGVRCVARYLWEEGRGELFAVDTVAGPIGLEVLEREHEVVVRVDVGVPRLELRYRDGATLDALDRTWRYGHIWVGNPHVVIFAEDPNEVDLAALGAELQRHPLFPQGINVHVACVSGPDTLAVRHYERGVGLTQACGTGAVAASVVAVEDGRVAAPVRVEVPGGRLEVEWRPNGRAFLLGPAEVEFERTLESG